jgi:hypothetical protein
MCISSLNSSTDRPLEASSRHERPAANLPGWQPLFVPDTLLVRAGMELPYLFQRQCWYPKGDVRCFES